MPSNTKPLIQITGAPLHPEDEARIQRTWYRPVQLPPEDETQLLCSRHRVMNLSRGVFAAYPETQDVPVDTDFGTLKEISRKSAYCTLCRLIIHHVASEHSNAEAEMNVIGCWIRDGRVGPDPSCSDGDSESTHQTRNTTLRLRVVSWAPKGANSFTSFDLVPLIEGKQQEEQLFFGRRVNPGQIDMELVASWIRSCDEWHGERCNPFGRKASSKTGAIFRPFLRLLDLEQNCIIETPAPDDYICLSYVWGTVPVFKTLLGNLVQMKTSGSFDSLIKRFPKSIRDAMTATGILGYRFLWVDSLCIVQDDPGDKAQQITMMGEIYRRAVMTLVVASGNNADAGINGLVPGSRKLDQSTAKCETSADGSVLTLVKLLPDCEQSIDCSAWNTRGWTYQERLLSTRCLYFAADTAYFQCPLATWGEDYFAEHPRVAVCTPMQTYELSRSWEPTVVSRSEEHQLHTYRRPYFREYCRIVGEYTARSMTFPSDRIPGVASVFARLTSATGCSFLYGLQEQLFLEALLWQPAARLRRVPDDAARGRPLYPSWSWAGWIGAVAYHATDDFNGLEPLKEHWRRSRPVESLNMHIQDLTTGELRRPNIPDYALPTRLAKGWCRVEPENAAQTGTIYVQGGKPDIYHSTPPIPAVCGKPLEDPYGIRIKSKLARLRLSIQDRTGKGGPIGRHWIHLGITSAQDGPWLGGIRLPGNWWLRKRRNQDNMSELYDFVLLSEAYGFGPDELASNYATSLDPYSVYNVMLVRRVASFPGLPVPSVVVVEREGVGRVTKEAWDAADGVEKEILIV